GTPLRNELEAIGPDTLSDATTACTEAITERFGAGPVDGKIQAHVFGASR
ncbi:SAM-dependent methyltransferase, partial [Burkholderia multivorans]